jgi:hypothetical protein
VADFSRGLTKINELLRRNPESSSRADQTVDYLRLMQAERNRQQSAEQAASRLAFDEKSQAEDLSMEQAKHSLAEKKHKDLLPIHRQQADSAASQARTQAGKLQNQLQLQKPESEEARGQVKQQGNLAFTRGQSYQEGVDRSKALSTSYQPPPLPAPKASSSGPKATVSAERKAKMALFLTKYPTANIDTSGIAPAFRGLRDREISTPGKWWGTNKSTEKISAADQAMAMDEWNEIWSPPGVLPSTAHSSEAASAAGEWGDASDTSGSAAPRFDLEAQRNAQRYLEATRPAFMDDSSTGTFSDQMTAETRLPPLGLDPSANGSGDPFTGKRRVPPDGIMYPYPSVSGSANAPVPQPAGQSTPPPPPQAQMDPRGPYGSMMDAISGGMTSAQSSLQNAIVPAVTAGVQRLGTELDEMGKTGRQVFDEAILRGNLAPAAQVAAGMIAAPIAVPGKLGYDIGSIIKFASQVGPEAAIDYIANDSSPLNAIFAGLMIRDASAYMSGKASAIEGIHSKLREMANAVRAKTGKYPWEITGFDDASLQNFGIKATSWEGVFGGKRPSSSGAATGGASAGAGASSAATPPPPSGPSSVVPPQSAPPAIRPSRATRPHPFGIPPVNQAFAPPETPAPRDTRPAQFRPPQEMDSLSAAYARQPESFTRSELEDAGVLPRGPSGFEAPPRDVIQQGAPVPQPAERTATQPAQDPMFALEDHASDILGAAVDAVDVLKFAETNDPSVAMQKIDSDPEAFANWMGDLMMRRESFTGTSAGDIAMMPAPQGSRLLPERPRPQGAYEVPPEMLPGYGKLLPDSQRGDELSVSAEDRDVYRFEDDMYLTDSADRSSVAGVDDSGFGLRKESRQKTARLPHPKRGMRQAPGVGDIEMKPGVTDPSGDRIAPAVDGSDKILIDMFEQSKENAALQRKASAEASRFDRQHGIPKPKSVPEEDKFPTDPTKRSMISVEDYVRGRGKSFMGKDRKWVSPVSVQEAANQIARQGAEAVLRAQVLAEDAAAEFDDKLAWITKSVKEKKIKPKVAARMRASIRKNAQRTAELLDHLEDHAAGFRPEEFPESKAERFRKNSWKVPSSEIGKSPEGKKGRPLAPSQASQSHATGKTSGNPLPVPAESSGPGTSGGPTAGALDDRLLSPAARNYVETVMKKNQELLDAGDMASMEEPDPAMIEQLNSRRTVGALENFDIAIQTKFPEFAPDLTSIRFKETSARELGDLFLNKAVVDLFDKHGRGALGDVTIVSDRSNELRAELMKRPEYLRQGSTVDVGGEKKRIPPGLNEAGIDALEMMMSEWMQSELSPEQKAAWAAWEKFDKELYDTARSLSKADLPRRLYHVPYRPKTLDYWMDDDPITSAVDENLHAREQVGGYERERDLAKLLPDYIKNMIRRQSGVIGEIEGFRDRLLKKVEGNDVSTSRFKPWLDRMLGIREALESDPIARVARALSSSAERLISNDLVTQIETLANGELPLLRKRFEHARETSPDTAPDIFREYLRKRGELAGLVEKTKFIKNTFSVVGRHPLMDLADAVLQAQFWNALAGRNVRYGRMQLGDYVGTAPMFMADSIPQFLKLQGKAAQFATKVAKDFMGEAAGNFASAGSGYMSKFFGRKISEDSFTGMIAESAERLRKGLDGSGDDLLKNIASGIYKHTEREGQTGLRAHSKSLIERARGASERYLMEPASKALFWSLNRDGEMSAAAALLADWNFMDIYNSMNPSKSPDFYSKIDARAFAEKLGPLIRARTGDLMEIERLMDIGDEASVNRARNIYAIAMGQETAVPSDISAKTPMHLAALSQKNGMIRMIAGMAAMFTAHPTRRAHQLYMVTGLGNARTRNEKFKSTATGMARLGAGAVAAGLSALVLMLALDAVFDDENVKKDKDGWKRAAMEGVQSSVIGVLTDNPVLDAAQGVLGMTTHADKGLKKIRDEGLYDAAAAGVESITNVTPESALRTATSVGPKLPFVGPYGTMGNIASEVIQEGTLLPSRVRTDRGRPLPRPRADKPRKGKKVNYFE